MLRRINAYFTRRRLAGTIVLFALALNAYVDYRLFLRNPDELEAQAKRFLQAALPGYRADFGARTEFNLFTGRLRLYDVKFHRREDEEQVLFEVPELVVESDKLIPTQLKIRAIRPVANLEVGPEGLRGIDIQGSEDEPLTSLPLDLQVEIEGGQVRLLIDDVEGISAELLVTQIGTLPGRPLVVRKDLSLEAALGLYAGALVPRQPGSPPSSLPGVPPNREARDIVPALTVELTRTRDGPLALVAGGRVSITQVIRSLIPLKFQTNVWDEIGPLRGAADIQARVVVPTEGGATVGVSIEPIRAAIKPKNFPVEISEIGGGGRFEVTVAIPAEGGEPQFLGVGWEGLRAKISAERLGDPGIGDLVSRGIVYPGRAEEGVSIQIQVIAKDLPLAPQIVRAFPPAIREVYTQFDPQGVLPEAHVMITKGPEERDVLVLRDGQRLPGLLDPRVHLVERPSDGAKVPSPKQPFQTGLDAALRFTDFQGRERLYPVRLVDEVIRNDSPQIAVWVPRLDGQVSACFEEVPARIDQLQGWFSLREGANVELEALGRLKDLGGRARVRAKVMHGDVISVQVEAREVPVSAALVECMPGSSKDMLRPFRLQGGDLDADVTVVKAHANAPIQPVVKARVRGVGFDHEAASMALVGSGSVTVIPRFEEEGQDDPSRIDVAMDLSLTGKGVTAALASGTLTLPPRQPEDGIEFSGDMRGVVEELELEVLPPPIRELLEVVRPRGAARGVRAHVRGPKRMRVSGVGAASLQVTPEAFPLPLRVSQFDVEVTPQRVLLHEVTGSRAPSGGLYRGTGWVGFPPEGSSGEEVDLSLEASLVDVPFDAAVVAALPEGPREPLERLEPSGLVSGKLTLDLRRGQRPEYSGDLALRDAAMTLHRISPAVRQLESAPLAELSGRLELSPLAIVARDFEGKVAGAQLRLDEGRLDLDPESGELVAFDLPARLRGLLLNDETRLLAGPDAQSVFEEFRPAGPVDLDLHTFQRGPLDEVHLHLLARLRGVRALPDLFPVPITDVRGEVEVEDGEPVRLDLAGRLSPAPLSGGFGAADSEAATLRVWRDASQEANFPSSGQAGRVYRVKVENWKRYPRIEGPDGPRSLRRRFEARLPESWRELLDQFDPGGSYDLEAWFYQPKDPDSPMRWAAETRVRDGAFTMVPFDGEPEEPLGPGERHGIAFTGIDGVVRLRGKLSEMELGSCQGELELSKADLFKQTFRRLRGAIQLQNGVFSVGVGGQPFVANFYDGDFLGRADYVIKSGAYDVSLALGLGRGARPGRLRAAMGELSELKEEPKSGPSFPYRGRLTAKVRFGGGGPDLLGKPRPLSGSGKLQLKDSNLLDTPFLRVFQILVARVRGSRASDPLPNLNVEFQLNETGLALQSADIWGRDLKVHGENGVLRYDGYIDIDVVPFDTSGGLHELLKWVPGTGYRYRGYVQDEPTLSPYLNPLSTIDWFRDLVQGEQK